MMLFAVQGLAKASRLTIACLPAPASSCTNFVNLTIRRQVLAMGDGSGYLRYQ